MLRYVNLYSRVVGQDIIICDNQLSFIIFSDSCCSLSSQAISHEQCLIFPTFDVSDTLEKSMEMLDIDTKTNFACNPTKAQNILLDVPRNLHWDKFEKKAAAQAENTTSNQNPATLDILQEEDEEEGEESDQIEKEEGLDIAWQYRTSVQKERMETVSKKSSSSSASSNIFCHSYDLSGRMAEQNLPLQEASSSFDTIVKEAAVRLNAGLVVSQTRSSAIASQIFRELASMIDRKQSQSPSKRVVRLVLYHYVPTVLEKLLPLLLAHVREKQLPVVVLVCSSASDSLEHPSSWINVQRTADVVMATEGFASRYEYPPPLEFQHLQGLLTLSKVSTVTAATANTGGHFADLTTTKRPTAYMYGLKRDRRKLHIPLLHIPPEDYAGSGGGSTSGVRSGAGLLGKESANKPQMGCASNTSGSLLDF